MLGAHEPLHLGQADERTQKRLGDLVGEQSGRGSFKKVEASNALSSIESPTNQRNSMSNLKPLDQLPLRADRIEKLQK